MEGRMGDRMLTARDVLGVYICRYNNARAESSTYNTSGRGFRSSHYEGDMRRRTWSTAVGSRGRVTQPPRSIAGVASRAMQWVATGETHGDRE